MSERGEFRSEENARQLLSFAGLRWGKITPTDIDLFVDFKNRAFVLGELKFAGTELPRGQELALERMARRWERGGCQVLALFAEHDAPIDETVVVAHAIVVRYWRDGEWRTPKNRPTVAQVIERFYIRYVERGA